MVARDIIVVLSIGFRGDTTALERETFTIYPDDPLEDTNGQMFEFLEHVVEEIREGNYDGYEGNADSAYSTSA